MSFISRHELLSIALRVVQLIFAVIVVVLNGIYLHYFDSPYYHAHFSEVFRSGYAVFIGSVSILLIIGMAVFHQMNRRLAIFGSWIVDLIVGINWFIVFGMFLGAHEAYEETCGSAFDWNDISFSGVETCSQWKANIAFCFLSGISWVVTSVLGFYILRRYYRRW